MSSEQKKEKILAMAAKAGFPAELYVTEAEELCAAGLIKIQIKRSKVGAFKAVWVLA